jgi:hypothetical protein
MVGHLVETTPDALSWTIAVLGLANLGLTLAAPKAGGAKRN